MTVSRNELAALFAEDDKLRAEREQEARRSGDVGALRRKSDEGVGLLYRVTETPVSAHSPDKPAAIYGHDDEQADDEPKLDFDTLAHAFALEADRVEKEQSKALEPLQREIAELKGRLDAALQIIGAKISRESDAQKRDDDRVVDLPDWRKRHVG